MGAIPKWLWGKRIGVWDLETDYIPTTLIYMNGVAFIDIDSTGNSVVTPSRTFTHKWTHYSHGSLMESIGLLKGCDYIAGHNLCGFDIPEVAKHLGLEISIPVLDTLILAKVMISKDELYGIDATLGIVDDIDWSRPYALDAFGKRLGNNKILFKEFSEMTEEMQIYCDQDVNLTCDLLLHLLNQENFPLEAVVTIEHKAAAIIAEQTKYGFYLDIDKTKALNTALLKEKGELFRELSAVFKPKWMADGKPLTYKKKSIVKKYLPNTKYIPLLGTT